MLRGMEHIRRVAATVMADSDQGGYVARALEVEVASQGETVEEALASLREALELYFEDGEQLPAQAPAPLVTGVDVRLGVA